MATTPEEITLDIDALDAAKAKPADDKPEIVIDDAPAAEKTEKKVLTEEKGLEKLREQLKTEREGRLAAQQQANDAATGEAAARADAQRSKLDLVKGAIEQLTQAGDVLEQQYEAAAAAQDWKAAAKAQREMANNAAKLQQLESGKTALEKAPIPAPRAPVDPVEDFCKALSPQSAAWVRAHPDFVRDPQKKTQMMAAHEIAMARGHAADTPGYFSSIEKTLDLSQGEPKKNGNGATHIEEDDDPTADAAKPVSGRSTTPAAAPVSRTNGSNRNVVTLSAAEVDMAESMGMTAEEYARNKLALKKEGKLQ